MTSIYLMTDYNHMEKEGINIKLMIVDDHKMFLDGIMVLINRLPHVEVKHVSSDGREALNYLNTNKDVDIIISDVSMPGFSGLELCEKINSFYPEIRVLILSMHDDANTIRELIDAGAAGYILKNTGKEELYDAIKAVKNGENYFSSAVKDNLINSMASTRKTFGKLSRREIEIIKLISQELTTNEIAEKLFISLHTVESHRKNILKKTNCRNIAGLIKYAIKERIIE